MRFLITTILLLFAVTGSAQVGPMTAAADTQTSPTAKSSIGFVDLEAVIENSRAIRNLLGSLDRELETLNREITEKQLQVQQTRDKLQRQGHLLSQEAREKDQSKAMRLLDEIEALQLRLDQKMRDHEMRAIQPILTEVIKTVGTVAREKNMSMVVRGEMVLYGQDQVNLTRAVIEKINSREDELRKMLDAQAPAKEESEEVLPLIPGQSTDTLHTIW